MQVSRILLLVALAGCSARGGSGAGEIAVVDVLDHTRVLAGSIGPRPSDTEASARAAAYIEEQLGEVERSPVGAVLVPAARLGSFQVMGGGLVEVVDDNLIVRFPGRVPGPALVFLAHYDTVVGSPGAADNAASVGILIELARALAARPPERPVVIAFTAAEEIGLVGARALAARIAPEVGLAVSLDMVGTATTALNGLGPLLGRSWLQWIAGHAEGIDLEAPLPHRVVSRLLPQFERSDHGAFSERGVPAFHLYGRGADRIHLAYHTPLDTPDRLDLAAVDGAARFAVALARRSGDFPRPGGDPGLWLPGTRVVLAGPLVYGIEAGLAALGILLLWQLLRSRGAEPRGRFGLLAMVVSLAVVWFAAHLVLRAVEGDHPVPWVHAPAAGLLAATGIAASLAALAWLSPIGRWPLAGSSRFVTAGVMPLLLAGFALLAAGALELAWAPLLAAVLLAAAALAPGRTGQLVLIALSLAPLAPLLAPAFLREAAFHGFYPRGLPVPLFLAVVLAPHTFAVVPIVRGLLPARGSLPRWSPAIAVALVIAFAAAAAIAARQVPCDAASFEALGLACEIAPE